eukprot:scaffold781_cov394-Prasinococcus_capsulatus_cf.AAC.22
MLRSRREHRAMYVANELLSSWRPGPVADASLPNASRFEGEGEGRGRARAPPPGRPPFRDARRHSRRC